MSLTGKQIGRNREDFQDRYVMKDQHLILIPNMSKEEEDKLCAALPKNTQPEKN
jgi:hypothetical protein